MEPCESTPETCAQLDHELLNLMLYRCPHTGAVTLWTTVGTTDNPVLTPCLLFGPFDDLDDMVDAAAVRVRSWGHRAGLVQVTGLRSL